MHIWWKNADFQRVSYIVNGFITLACFNGPYAHEKP